MAKEIKTRHINRDIKTLDKTVTAAEHMKRSYVRTKESAGQAQEQDSPDEYAQDKMAQGAGKTVRTSSEQMKKVISQSRRAVHEIRERKRGAKEYAHPLSSAEVKPHQPKEQPIRQEQAGAASDRMVKTTGREEKTAKTTGKWLYRVGDQPV